MIIYIVIGVYAGVVDTVEAFLDEEKAHTFEKEVCEQLGIPYDTEERIKYQSGVHEHNVHFYTVEAK